MTDKEYFDCKFIDKYMSFFTIVDFYENCKFFKAKFKNMTANDVYLYKWYIYANTHISLKDKDLMWNYLTTPDITEEIILHGKLRALYVSTLRENTKYDV